MGSGVQEKGGKAVNLDFEKDVREACHFIGKFQRENGSRQP